VRAESATQPVQAQVQPERAQFARAGDVGAPCGRCGDASRAAPRRSMLPTPCRRSRTGLGARAVHRAASAAANTFGVADRAPQGSNSSRADAVEKIRRSWQTTRAWPACSPHGEHAASLAEAMHALMDRNPVEQAGQQCAAARA
jgi:hypothetical protein